MNILGLNNLLFGLRYMYKMHNTEGRQNLRSLMKRNQSLRDIVSRIR